MESERRWNNGLIAMGVVGYRYPACARTEDRVPAKSVVMTLCSCFLLTLFTAEGVVTLDIMVTMATDARGPVWVDREAQLAADAEEEHWRGEAIFDATAGHCNEWVGWV